MVATATNATTKTRLLRNNPTATISNSDPTYRGFRQSEYGPSTMSILSLRPPINSVAQNRIAAPVTNTAHASVLTSRSSHDPATTRGAENSVRTNAGAKITAPTRPLKRKRRLSVTVRTGVQDSVTVHSLLSGAGLGERTADRSPRGDVKTLDPALAMLAHTRRIDYNSRLAPACKRLFFL
jgi:hypothetical protein